MILRSLSICGVALLAARHAEGQSAAADPSSPPGRAHHLVFYDDARQRVMLTGGAANDARRHVTAFNDLWSFDGTAWALLGSTGDTLLGARVGIDAQMRIHAFGGFGDSAVGDLRMLEHDRWRRIGVHPSIVAAEGGFVFDEARTRFVAFGGSSGAQRMTRDVWEYDGTRWTKNPAAGPPARGAHAMVYDPHRKRIVVFGGMGVRSGDQDTPIFADTWEFDGTTWTQMRVAGPPPRLGAGIAYDSKRRLVILFGGGHHDGVRNDLWSWDGTSWKKLAEGGPEPRVMGYIAYDKRRDRIVLFGGRRGVPDNSDLGDTWEWDGATWRRINP
jgi:hypothetical protein